jgi:hypothetical protein
VHQLGEGHQTLELLDPAVRWPYRQRSFCCLPLVLCH